MAEVFACANCQDKAGCFINRQCRIDTQFAGMATDEKYQREAMKIAELGGASPVPSAPTCPTAERDSQGSYDECSDEAVELLAVIENADYDEGGAAVFELRKICSNLDRYVKDEVSEQIERLAASPVPSAAPTCPRCGDSREGFYFSAIGSVGCVVHCRKCGEGFDCTYDLNDFAAFFSPQARGYTLLQGRNVYVDNPQFQGYGIAQYDSGERKRVIGVLLENGNTWEYDAATVRAAREDERDKFPPHMRLLASEE